MKNVIVKLDINYFHWVLLVRACYEIKKSVGSTFDTSKCCRKWFSISYTKRKPRNCEWPLKLLGEKNQHLLGKLIFKNWPKCACVGCTRQIWGNQDFIYSYILSKLTYLNMYFAIKCEAEQ